MTRALAGVNVLLSLSEHENGKLFRRLVIAHYDPWRKMEIPSAQLIVEREMLQSVADASQLAFTALVVHKSEADADKPVEGSGAVSIAATQMQCKESLNKFRRVPQGTFQFEQPDDSCLLQLYINGCLYNFMDVNVQFVLFTADAARTQFVVKGQELHTFPVATDLPRVKLLSADQKWRACKALPNPITSFSVESNLGVEELSCPAQYWSKAGAPKMTFDVEAEYSTSEITRIFVVVNKVCKIASEIILKRLQKSEKLRVYVKQNGIEIGTPDFEVWFIPMLGKMEVSASVYVWRAWSCVAANVSLNDLAQINGVRDAVELLIECAT